MKLLRLFNRACLHGTCKPVLFSPHRCKPASHSSLRVDARVQRARAPLNKELPDPTVYFQETVPTRHERPRIVPLQCRSRRLHARSHVARACGCELPPVQSVALHRPNAFVVELSARVGNERRSLVVILSLLKTPRALELASSLMNNPVVMSGSVSRVNVEASIFGGRIRGRDGFGLHRQKPRAATGTASAAKRAMPESV